MTTFTPLSAFSGGLLIGLAATLLLLCNGRIAGISGMLGGLMSNRGGELYWRLAFLLGLIVSATVLNWFNPAVYQPRTGFPMAYLLLGGFLVGFGTRMGNGCTSGHAVCGIARFSLRSLAATAVFMTTGFVTVYLVRHVLG